MFTQQLQTGIKFIPGIWCIINIRFRFCIHVLPYENTTIICKIYGYNVGYKESIEILLFAN